jgi:hypothetical protein
MDTFNDMDLVFLLIDVFVLTAGVFAVGAWYIDHRRNAQHERDPVALSGK